MIFCKAFMPIFPSTASFKINILRCFLTFHQDFIMNDYLNAFREMSPCAALQTIPSKISVLISGLIWIT